MLAEWLIKLQDDGRGYSTIHTVWGVVRPAFQMALDDDLISRTPFEFQFSTIVVNDSVAREAIPIKQEKLFLEFVRNDKHFSRYHDDMLSEDSGIGKESEIALNCNEKRV